jgi:hypothetical protein
VYLKARFTLALTLVLFYLRNRLRFVASQKMVELMWN